MIKTKTHFPIMKQQYPQSGGKKVKEKVKAKRKKKALDGVKKYFKKKVKIDGPGVLTDKEADQYKKLK